MDGIWRRYIIRCSGTRIATGAYQNHLGAAGAARVFSNDIDSDDDGLSDGDEVNIYGTIYESDSDDDGLSDGDEVLNSTYELVAGAYSGSRRGWMHLVEAVGWL